MDKKLIKQIENYLSVYFGENALSQNKNTQDFFATLKSKNDFMSAFCLNNTKDNLGVIEDILEQCDNETLDDIAQHFGYDSEIGQLILRKKEYDFQTKAKELNRNMESSLKDLLDEAKHYGNPFYEAVCEHIDKKGFKSDADFYNSISMPRQQFARLRDPGNVLSKKTVLWIIVGLQLNYKDASDLIKKAGYSFKKNDMRDVILTYIFRNTSYTLDSVNEILDYFELQTLC